MALRRPFENRREALLEYARPGNARELKNAIERAIILCEGVLIAAEHLPLPAGATATTSVRALRG